jgi:hypothetical protein
MSSSLLLTAASILCWCVSLLLPAVDLGFVLVRGWQFLIHGWQGLVSLNIGGLSWLANPLLVGAWLCFFLWPRRRGLLIWWAVAALAVALTSFLYNALGSAQQGIRIEDFALGFYLWLASALLQTVAAMVRLRE